jgi:hypothetical protein
MLAKRHYYSVPMRVYLLVPYPGGAIKIDVVEFI